eukprot:TRINITY_DN11044_c0_g1_i1.p1 TRINITY_DN11044_c0_g1~~TRINITY_DN11044_c0_g1_i1.p1  ORF type:complete len:341 (-),score=70.73 TRINITY_DN11044_c0_g1_i1:340-1362(-)
MEIPINLAPPPGGTGGFSWMQPNLGEGPPPPPLFTDPLPPEVLPPIDTFPSFDSLPPLPSMPPAAPPAPGFQLPSWLRDDPPDSAGPLGAPPLGPPPPDFGPVPGPMPLLVEGPMGPPPGVDFMGPPGPPPPLGPPPMGGEFEIKPPSTPPPPTLPSSVPGGVDRPIGQPQKKRKVEGLASSRNIKSGGSVTIYSGYAATTASKPSEQPKNPVVEQAAAATAPQASSLLAGATEAVSRQLPDGWEMKKSRSSGKIYYVNAKLGVSQFDPPAGSTVKASASASKKQKVSVRAKDGAIAHKTDMNGLAGVVRANDTSSKKGRGQKSMKTSAAIHEPSPEKDD